MPAERWITDLACAAPAAAISRDGAPGTWIAVDYQVAGAAGVMLFALPGDEAPPLTLSLGAAGWHEIRLGLYYGGGAGALEDRVLLARLTGDPAFARLGREPFRPEKDGQYPEKATSWSDV
ncbi:MAG: hypothetical protein ABIL09_24860, partial [Gemmatimonadota bacterium]